MIFEEKKSVIQISHSQAQKLIGVSIAILLFMRILHEFIVMKLGIGILNLSWAWIDDYVVDVVLKVVYFPLIIFTPPLIKGGGLDLAVLSLPVMVVISIIYVCYTMIVSRGLAAILVNKGLFNGRVILGTGAVLFIFGLAHHLIMPIPRWKEARQIPEFGSQWWYFSLGQDYRLTGYLVAKRLRASGVIFYTDLGTDNFYIWYENKSSSFFFHPLRRAKILLGAFAKPNNLASDLGADATSSWWLVRCHNFGMDRCSDDPISFLKRTYRSDRVIKSSMNPGEFLMYFKNPQATFDQTLKTNFDFPFMFARPVGQGFAERFGVGNTGP